VEHFFFIIGIWVYVKRILEESRRCRPRYARGGCFEFKRPQDAGKVVVAVGLNLVKLFQRWKVKYLLRRQLSAEAALRRCLMPFKLTNTG
jgi:hypothetical protein